MGPRLSTQLYRDAHFGGIVLAILEGLAESCDELAAKDLTQNRLGQEVVVPRVDPAGVIEREAAGGNDDMEMRMEAPTRTVP